MVSQASIGGISQPIIGQKKIEHEIRLKDGESSLIGGIFDDSQTKALSGIPGLAQIPILGYLFGQRTQDHSQDETVLRSLRMSFAGRPSASGTSVPSTSELQTRSNYAT